MSFGYPVNREPRIPFKRITAVVLMDGKRYEKDFSPKYHSLWFADFFSYFGPQWADRVKKEKKK